MPYECPVCGKEMAPARTCEEEELGVTVERCFECGTRYEVVDVVTDIPLPDAPTDAAPGSAWKIEIMTTRAEGGHSVFHPGDNLAPDREPHGATGASGASGRRLPPGVSRCNGRFRAKWWFGGRGDRRDEVSLGVYDTPEEAAGAVRAARRRRAREAGKAEAEEEAARKAG